MLEQNLRNFKILVGILIISWLYTGFLRIYIFRSLANYLYFLPYAIMILIFIYSIIRLRHQMVNLSLFILLNGCFLTFQVFHIMLSDISIVTGIYGYCLYMLPINFLSLTRVLAEVNVKDQFMKLMMFAATPNLLLALLQTFVPNSQYSRGIIDENNATTTGGFSRAYGTFTAPAGYAIFLSVLTVCILILPKSKNNLYTFVLYLELAALYVFSGSRTVFFSLLVILGFNLVSNSLKHLGKSFFGIVKATLGSIFLFVVATQLLAIGPFIALLERVSRARTEESTSGRIFENIFGFMDYIYQPFFGSGLGSYAIGTVGYENVSQWIELDLIRNIFELGTVFGLLWILFRFFLFLYLPIKFINRADQNSLLLFSSTAPYLLFGPIAGQSTISVGCWLVIAIAISSSSARNTINK
jgi:hypothetical protein